MALKQHVKDRYGDQFLISLSNPYNRAATAIDEGRMDLAVQDVEADFGIYVGVDYDDTNTLHVNVAVEGVIAKLKVRTGMKAAKGDHDAYLERMEALSLTQGRDRSGPDTSSRYQPSREEAGQQPAFDNRIFVRVIPRDQMGRDFERHPGYHA